MKLRYCLSQEIAVSDGNRLCSKFNNCYFCILRVLCTYTGVFATCLFRWFFYDLSPMSIDLMRAAAWEVFIWRDVCVVGIFISSYSVDLFEFVAVPFKLNNRIRSGVKRIGHWWLFFFQCVAVSHVDFQISTETFHSSSSQWKLQLSNIVSYSYPSAGQRREQKPFFSTA